MKASHSTLRRPYLLLSLLLITTEALQADTYTDPTSGLVLHYFIANGQAIITGGTVPSDGILIVPETLGGAPARYIRGDSFKNNTHINRLTAESVRVIGSRAFKNCTSLTDVSLPSATDIDYSAFFECTSLARIWLPEVSLIGEWAFGLCINLRHIYLGSNPTLENTNALSHKPADQTIHHHPEYAAHFAAGNWAPQNKNPVVRPFSEPFAIVGSLSDLIIVRIRRDGKGSATAAEDWTYLIERSTDLGNPNSWATITPDSSEPKYFDSTNNQFTDWHEFNFSLPTAFYRVQASPTFMN